MNTPKLLTVVIPSYNQGEYLSVSLSQLSKYSNDVDIIVLDGGSTDSSVSVIKKYEAFLKYWVSEKDGGQAAAINKGLNMAATEWIAFQNSDDFYIDENFSDVLNFIKKSTADIVIGGVGFSNADGEIFIRSAAKPILVKCLCVKNFIHNQSFFIKKDFLNRVGVLDASLSFCLDFDWFIRAMILNPRIGYFSPIVGVQRIHEDTKTAKMQDVHDKEFSLIVKKYFTSIDVFMGYFLFLPYVVFRRIYGFFIRN